MANPRGKAMSRLTATVHSDHGTDAWYELNVKERAILLASLFDLTFTDDNGQYLLYHSLPLDPTEDAIDGYGPGGKYGLGRGPCWEHIRPPIDFEDVWFALSIWKRIQLLRNGWKPFRLLAASLVNTLNHFDGAWGDRLVNLLAKAPNEVFPNYINLAVSECRLPRQRSLDTEVFWVFEWDWHEEITSNGYLCSQSGGNRDSCDYWYEEPTSSVCDEVHDHMPRYLRRSPNACQNPQKCPSWNAGCHCGFRDVEYEDSDPGLIQRIHDLPPEVFEYLKEVFLQHIIGPRTAMADVRTLSPHVLRSLDRANASYAQKNFIETNTWIMPPGSFGYSFQNESRLLPRPFESRIRKVHLSLSQQDPCKTCIKHIDDWLDPDFPSMANTAAWRIEYDSNVDLKHHDWNIVEVINQYDYYVRYAIEDLHNLWLERFEYVTRLQLDYLLLDMRDTYGPHGTYEGVDVASRFPRFSSEFPSTFEVLAPTAKQAKEIQDMIVARNVCAESEIW